ncbi:MAG: AAA family ATPase [Myxococcales bacterium]|nr:AAA family ATPase [Myxococcales bacterium]
MYARPLADPSIVARATRPEDVIAAQVKYLGYHLGKIQADRIADFIYPEGTALRHVEVLIERADLPRRIRIESTLELPCVVIPDGAAFWVLVVPLAHMLYVRPGEDLDRKIVDEIKRATAAREIRGPDLLALLPGEHEELVTPEVSTSRGDRADAAGRAEKRRAREGAKALADARKLLAKVATDVRQEGARLRPTVLGRDREIGALRAALAGRERLSVALIGPEMSGKTAIFDGLLQARAGPLKDRPIYATSGAQLVAGQSGFGQLEERIDQVMRAVELVDAILYFDDLGDLFAGHTGGIEDMAAIMRPYLDEGRVRIVGELTPEHAEQYEKRHVGFFSCLHRIAVEPLTEETTLEILIDRIAHDRRREPERPSLAPEAAAPLVELARRYLSYESFPGKAVRLYDELRAIHEGEVADDGAPVTIGAAAVYNAFSIRSGIPTFLLRDERAMKFEAVVEAFRRRVIGQEEAIVRVAETLCAVKAGLQPPGKPLSTFLFVGPTGVGKTEVAKTLARFLFGDVGRLLRFDMSEYMDPLAAERLIRGTQRDDGELTRKVRQQPFCVVLLDEIEKAHPAVFDLLLQVCGEGRLSDARGKTTYFHNAIIIMTSNLGAAHRRPRSGFRVDGDRAQAAAAEHRHYVERVDAHFRPEFVNRLDRIISFRSLSAAEIGEVARVSLARIRERAGLVNRGIDLRVSDAVLARLARDGYSDTYGARALRRHLEDALVTPVATVLARFGSLAVGASVHVTDDELEDDARVDDGGDGELGASLGGHRFGPLMIMVYRRPNAQTQGSTYGLQRIASLRRMARSCLTTGPIEEMQDRVDYLVAELATAPSAERQRLPPADVARLTAEHARLAERLRELREEVRGIEIAEDLAMAALFEGEELEPYRTEAEAAFLRIERAMVRAILGAASGALTILVQPQDDPRALVRWLLPFLDGAEARGWQCLAHIYDDHRDGDEWPESVGWGPPRPPAELRERLEEADEATLAKAFRGVILCVQGPGVPGYLSYEMGLQRWESIEDDDPLMHLQLSTIATVFPLTAALLTTPAVVQAKTFALPRRIPREQLARTDVVRLFRSDGSLYLPTERREFEDWVVNDYWAELEHILFEQIAGPLARGENPGSGLGAEGG